MLRSEKEWKVIVKKAMGHAKQGQPVIDGGQAVTDVAASRLGADLREGGEVTPDLRRVERDQTQDADLEGSDGCCIYSATARPTPTG